MFARLTGRDIRQRLDRDAAALTPPSPGSAVSQEQVASLPETVQRYFRFTDVVGKPAVSSFRAHLSGRFRLRRGQQFMPVEVWQYNAVAPIVRLFWMLAELPLALSTHRPSIRRLGVVENCEQEPPHSWVLAQHTLSPRVVRAIHLASPSHGEVGRSAWTEPSAPVNNMCFTGEFARLRPDRPHEAVHVGEGVSHR